MRGLLLALAAAAAFIMPATAADSPGQMIRAIYAAYEKNGQDPDAKIPDLLDKALYTRRVGKLIDALQKSCKDAQEICGPDFDFFVDGQDFDIKNVAVKEIESGDDRAVVEARFTNMGQPRTITFTLKKGDRGWVIDDFRSAGQGESVPYTLEEVIKP